MVPAALAIVVAAFPVRERGKALAIFFGVSGGLTSIGPIAGGFSDPVDLAGDLLDQRAGRRAGPGADRRGRDPDGAPGRADRLPRGRPGGGRDGAVGARVRAGLDLGLGHARTWLCIIGGLVLLAVFVAVEAAYRDAAESRSGSFVGRAFVIDNLVLFFSMIAFIPVFFFASVYSQVSLGYNANQAGLYLLLFFAGFAPAAQIGGRMLDRARCRPADA